MNYYLITAENEFSGPNCDARIYSGCCGGYTNPDIIESIAKASTYGYTKLTKTSLIIRSNQNIEYWKVYIRDTLKCHMFHIMNFNIVNNSLTGYLYKGSWDWINESKKDSLDKNTCKADNNSFTKCE